MHLMVILVSMWWQDLQAVAHCSNLWMSRLFWVFSPLCLTLPVQSSLKPERVSPRDKTQHLLTFIVFISAACANRLTYSLQRAPSKSNSTKYWFWKRPKTSVMTRRNALRSSAVWMTFEGLIAFDHGRMRRVQRKREWWREKTAR